MSEVEQDLKRIEEIGPLLKKIKKEQKQLVLLRWGFIVLILIVFSGWVWSLVGHFKKFDADTLGNEFLTKTQDTLPTMAEELNKLIENVYPVVEASFANELEAAVPKISEKFTSEANDFEKNMKIEIGNSMKEFLTADRRISAVNELKKKFPSLAGKNGAENLAAALQESFFKSGETELTLMFTQYYDIINKFQGAFNKIKAQLPSEGSAATMERVLELWLELVYEKMGGDESILTTKAKRAKK